MNSALLGVVAALSWGVHDFLARFPSRAVGPIPTVLAVTVAGLIALSAWLLIGGGDIRLVWPELWLVAVTGIFFTLATLALFSGAGARPDLDRRADRRLLPGARHDFGGGARRAPERVAMAGHHRRDGGRRDRVAERRPL